MRLLPGQARAASIVICWYVLRAFFSFSYASDRPGIFGVSYAAVDLCAAPPHARYRAFEALELVAANSLPCRVFLVSRRGFVGLALTVC